MLPLSLIPALTPSPTRNLSLHLSLGLTFNPTLIRLALAWAVCSVFVFVPYISRGSREVLTLTLTLTATLARGQP